MTNKRLAAKAKNNPHKVFLDPRDASRAYIGDIVLTNVHSQLLCEGRNCCIHNPSQHIMRDLPLHWRIDRGIMERICYHGVGHPDLDDFKYNWSIGNDIGIHGCCAHGCCSERQRGDIAE